MFLFINQCTGRQVRGGVKIFHDLSTVVKFNLIKQGTKYHFPTTHRNHLLSTGIANSRKNSQAGKIIFALFWLVNFFFCFRIKSIKILYTQERLAQDYILCATSDGKVVFFACLFVCLFVCLFDSLEFDNCWSELSTMTGGSEHDVSVAK